MIKTFRGKLLKDLHEGGRGRLGLREVLPPSDSLKIRELLFALDAATGPEDLNSFEFELRRVPRGRFKGQWTLQVRGARRLIFRFIDGNVHDVDYALLPMFPKIRK